jgi:hypothetical protein
VSDVKLFTPTYRPSVLVLRMFLWMAIAVELGVSPYQATRFGIAHEEDGGDNNAGWGSRDSNIDLNNNQVGAAVGMNVVKRDGELKPLSGDKTPLQDAYYEIADLIRTNGCNAAGCIDTSSKLG